MQQVRCGVYPEVPPDLWTFCPFWLSTESSIPGWGDSCSIPGEHWRLLSSALQNLMGPSLCHLPVERAPFLAAFIPLALLQAGELGWQMWAPRLFIFSLQLWETNHPYPPNLNIWDVISIRSTVFQHFGGFYLFIWFLCFVSDASCALYSKKNKRKKRKENETMHTNPWIFHPLAPCSGTRCCPTAASWLVVLGTTDASRSSLLQAEPNCWLSRHRAGVSLNFHYGGNNPWQHCQRLRKKKAEKFIGKVF